MLTFLLPTERSGVTVRQLATAEDDEAYFEAIHEDAKHVDQFDNEVSSKCSTVEEIKKARLSHSLKLLMGIWDGNSLKGGINALPRRDHTEAEIGYWLRASATGNGYATLALTALTDFLRPTYGRLFAEVREDNYPSIGVLERAGYEAVNTDYRLWSYPYQIIVFEPAQL